MKKILNNYSSKNDINIRQIVAYKNNVLEIEYNNKGQIKKLSINKEEIKLIRLAIKF